MMLSIRVPSGVTLGARADKVVAEAPNGQFCLLPRHVDLATVLVPGILSFVDERGDERFVAIDRAVLVKRGAEVDVAALRAVVGPELLELERTVHEQFEQLGESELRARSALARLEIAFRKTLFEAGEGLRP